MSPAKPPKRPSTPSRPNTPNSGSGPTTTEGADAPDYPLSADMLTAMLRVTRITSPAMQQALYDYLVAGDTQTAAAERHGYSRQQLAVHARQLRERIKPAFDAYAHCVKAGRKPRA